jgi:hypothetical protein
VHGPLFRHVVNGGSHERKKQGKSLVGGEACSYEQIATVMLQSYEVIAGKRSCCVVESTLVIDQEKRAGAQSLCERIAGQGSGRIGLGRKWSYGDGCAGEA